MEIPDGYILLAGVETIRRGDKHYVGGAGYRLCDPREFGRRADSRVYRAVIRGRNNVRRRDAVFPDGSLVEIFSRWDGKALPQLRLEYAAADWAEADRRRAEAEKFDPAFADYWAAVTFRRPPKGDSFGEKFAASFNSRTERYEEGDTFTIRTLARCKYDVFDERNRVVVSGILPPGFYRFHNGFIEKLVGLDWRRPKRFREDKP